MGQYLCVGICRNITIYKEELKGATAPDIATKTLQENFDLDLYDKSEDDTSLSWNIKKDVLENGLLDFLKAQLEICCGDKDNSDLYELIRQAKTYENIIARAKDKCDEHFQEEYFSQREINLGFGRWGKVHYEIIVFLIAGKIMMESYGGLFNYFEKMICLQKDKYPLAGSVKIFISL